MDVDEWEEYSRNNNTFKKYYTHTYAPKVTHKPVRCPVVTPPSRLSLVKRRNLDYCLVQNDVEYAVAQKAHARGVGF